MRLTNAICALLDLWEEVNIIRKSVDNIRGIDELEKEQVQNQLENLNNKIRAVMTDLRITRKKYVHDYTSTPTPPNTRSDEETAGK